MNKILRGILALGLNATLMIGAGHPAQAAGGGTPTNPATLPQMRSWMFSPLRVDFTQGATPTVSTVPGAPTTGAVGGPTAAAYDDNNNLLFYCVRASWNFSSTYYGADVYAPSGAFATDGESANGGGISGTYSNVTGFNYRNLAQEVCVVPMPGLCKQFSLLYILSTGIGSGNSALVSSVVDCTGATPVVGAPTIICEIPGSTSGFAVSKLTNGTRYVYTVGGGAIRRTPLSRAGFGATVVDLTTGLFAPSEVDLSPDGTRLAFGGGVNSIKGLCRAEVNPSTGVVSNFQVTHTDPGATTSGSMLGVEFSLDNTKIYYGGGYPGSSNPPGPTGIFEYTIATGGLRLLPGTRAFAQSMIEAAHDGLLYAVGSYDQQTGGAESERLLSINPTTGTAALSPVTTHFQTLGNGYGYVLPDQIDGEDYALFAGTSTPTISTVFLGGQLNSIRATTLYTCNPYTLTSTARGAANVQLTFTPSDAAGNPVAAPVLTTGWLVQSDFPTDIKALGGGYFANPSVTGYFQVKLEARNNCGQLTTFLGRVLINAATSVTAGLAFNRCSGGAVDAATTSVSAPAVVGVNTGSLNLSTTSSNATSYSIWFERFDSGSSTFQSVGSLVTGYISGGTLPSALPLSDLASQAGLSSTYFAPGGPGNNVLHRLRYDAGNPCGTATVQGYFRPADVSCRTSLAGPASALYPNPATDEVLVQAPSDQGGNAEWNSAASISSVRVYDSYGTLRLEQIAKPGAAVVRLRVTQLPTGLYTVHMLRGQKVVERQSLQITR